MNDDETARLKRAIRRIKTFASEVGLTERFCLKFSVVTFVAWIMMVFIVKLEVSSLVLIAAVCFFVMYVLLRETRIRILSILKDLNGLL